MRHVKLARDSFLMSHPETGFKGMHDCEQARATLHVRVCYSARGKKLGKVQKCVQVHRWFGNKWSYTFRSVCCLCESIFQAS